MALCLAEKRCKLSLTAFLYNRLGNGGPVMGKCQACSEASELPFTFKMAFQPIVDVSQHSIWGYEALVRGAKGEGAHSILSQLTESQLYRFDQAARRHGVIGIIEERLLDGLWYDG